MFDTQRWANAIVNLNQQIPRDSLAPGFYAFLIKYTQLAARCLELRHARLPNHHRYKQVLLELCIAWVRHHVTIVVLCANSVRDRNIREAGMEPHFCVTPVSRTFCRSVENIRCAMI